MPKSEQEMSAQTIDKRIILLGLACNRDSQIRDLRVRMRRGVGMHGATRVVEVKSC